MKEKESNRLSSCSELFPRLRKKTSRPDVLQSGNITGGVHCVHYVFDQMMSNNWVDRHMLVRESLILLFSLSGLWHPEKTKSLLHVYRLSLKMHKWQTGLIQAKVKIIIPGDIPTLPGDMPGVGSGKWYPHLQPGVGWQTRKLNDTL